MANEVDEKVEQVKQHHRMAAGAWVDGESMKEQGSATIPHANSDHGNFSGKGVEKSNA